MERIEILAGGMFKKAVQDLGLASANRTYRYRMNQSDVRESYQVWELSKEDFDRLCAVNDADWKKKWGWWRHTASSVPGHTNHEYIIHGKKIEAWDGYMRMEWEDICSACCSDRERGLCRGTAQDFELCFGKREYPNIISYLRREMGVSTEKNVCACTAELARQNNMKLSEFFKQYLG